ncbi:UDP-N-acetylmuramate--L-alanine ligase [Mucilaginibacter terrae]|uniref:UDP-N-acetylmuramate: L-alanyl-gamma-D-glutamyl-meso-diaminopimelate ligase n=1 Tax=Mucilaginibacter terrae TaxID=1955052 RepID=A0ABU3GT55_9SPHI|nr:Mur ligase family protein [Mucilaginibacter terrae]MDT3401840.1 UDP-N-acetylmuramate: L-alanyl-gamma-D-glutamyl-meso-diaminopimelate ligase [Mucilaginibacter terrae]
MKVHFIAIGGSAMHNLAIALHKKGFEVTGSDDVLFEPSISRLAKQGILPEQNGWYPEKITNDIDAVILGMHARVDNPELLAAQQKGIKIYSYPEYVYEQSKDKLRVVIGGSHGKTTITSMILHALQAAGKQFDYLVGAQLEGFDTMVQLSDAPLIVIEGDEYLSSPIDRRPKFHLYKANIGIISGIAWDHINVFPTFENYIHQFEIFIQTIQPQGSVFYAGNDDVLKKLVEDNQSPVTKTAYNLPEYEVVNGITSVNIGEKKYPLQVFGEHNLLNMEAARSVCAALGIAADGFYSSMVTFKGAARRLELLGKNEVTNIYKDFAHSPSKLKATINAVKTQFPFRELIACMELHTFSSLNKEFLSEYAGCMDEADKAIVFIDAQTFVQKKMEPYDAEVVKAAFDNTDLLFFDQQQDLAAYLEQQDLTGKNLLLMSSGNFGGINLNELSTKFLNK